MDIRRLRYFVAVAEEGNVGRAARRLHMSQPPLSQRIRELESELGCALFVRTPRGMTLTAPGEVLLAGARTLLADAEQIRQRVRRAAGEQVLRVGVLGPGEAALSADIARVFNRRHPEVTVRLRQGDFADPTLGLAAGEVDVAITFAPFDQTGIVTRIVDEQPCYAALPSRDPLAELPSITRADLRDRTSIRLPDGADRAWRAFWQPLPGGDGPEVRSLDECLHAILWERAVAVVPEKVVRGHATAGVAYVPLADQPPARLVLASRSTDRSPLVAAYLTAFTASR